MLCIYMQMWKAGPPLCWTCLAGLVAWSRFRLYNSVFSGIPRGTASFPSRRANGSVHYLCNAAYRTNKWAGGAFSFIHAPLQHMYASAPRLRCVGVSEDEEDNSGKTPPTLWLSPTSTAPKASLSHLYSLPHVMSILHYKIYYKGSSCESLDCCFF